MSTFLLRKEKLGETTNVSPSPLAPRHCEMWEKKSHLFSSAPFTSTPPSVAARGQAGEGGGYTARPGPGWVGLPNSEVKS